MAAAALAPPAGCKRCRAQLQARLLAARRWQLLAVPLHAAVLNSQPCCPQMCLLQRLHPLLCQKCRRSVWMPLRRQQAGLSAATAARGLSLVSSASRSCMSTSQQRCRHAQRSAAVMRCAGHLLSQRQRSLLASSTVRSAAALLQAVAAAAAAAARRCPARSCRSCWERPAQMRRVQHGRRLLPWRWRTCLLAASVAWRPPHSWHGACGWPCRPCASCGCSCCWRLSCTALCASCLCLLVP